MTILDHAGSTDQHAQAEDGAGHTPATTIEEALAAPQLTCVGLYLVDRAWGGAEEGGWWFDYGELVEDPEIYKELGAMPATFPTLGDAGSFMRGLNDAVNRLNEGRPDIGQTNSRGRYELMSFDGVSLPKHFPDRRPTYE